jgi:hypothetical protein
VRPNLGHLAARMRQSGHFDGDTLTPEQLAGLLHARFAEIDFQQAAAEVRPFVRDARELALWSREFFDGLVERITEP